MMLIARETTNPIRINAKTASSIMRNFARCDKGMVSAHCLTKIFLSLSNEGEAPAGSALVQAVSTGSRRRRYLSTGLVAQVLWVNSAPVQAKARRAGPKAPSQVAMPIELNVGEEIRMRNSTWPTKLGELVPLRKRLTITMFSRPLSSF
jgi:hypothetical protein